MDFYGTHYTTRKILCSFMDFFSRTSIEKFKTENNLIVHHKFVRVPIQFASAEKWLQVLRSGTARKGFDPALLNSNPVELEYALPRLSVNLVGMNYASERHIAKTQRIRDYESQLPSNTKNVYSPVPYNLDIELVAIAKNLNELFQITEQIIPFFTPSLSLDIRIFEDKDPESINFSLSSVSPDILDEITEPDDRIFSTSFSFIARANYYLPKKFSKTVTSVTQNTFDMETLTKFNGYIQTAENLNPVGDLSERADLDLNPVIRTDAI